MVACFAGTRVREGAHVSHFFYRGLRVVTADGAQDPSVRCAVTGDMSNKASSRLYQLEFEPVFTLGERPLPGEATERRSVVLLGKWMELMSALCTWGRIHHVVEDALVRTLSEEMRSQLRSELEEPALKRIKDQLTERLKDSAFIGRLSDKLRRAWVVLSGFFAANVRTQTRKELSEGLLGFLEAPRQQQQTAGAANAPEQQNGVAH
jgi:hypothetical protein